MNLGISEMIFIFVAALILVGPKKLPEIMRQVGKWMAEFKRASNEFKWQIETEMRNMEMEAERSKQTILPPVAPPLGTIASGAVIDGATTQGALTNGVSTHGTVPESLSEPQTEPQPALTNGATSSPSDTAAAPTPAKSVDA